MSKEEETAEIQTTLTVLILDFKIQKPVAYHGFNQWDDHPFLAPLSVSPLYFPSSLFSPLSTFPRYFSSLLSSLYFPSPLYFPPLYLFHSTSKVVPSPLYFPLFTPPFLLPLLLYYPLSTDLRRHVILLIAYAKDGGSSGERGNQSTEAIN